MELINLVSILKVISVANVKDADQSSGNITCRGQSCFVVLDRFSNTSSDYKRGEGFMREPASNEGCMSYIPTTGEDLKHYNTSKPNCLRTGPRLEERCTTSFPVLKGDRINLKMKALGISEVPKPFLEPRCT